MTYKDRKPDRKKMKRESAEAGFFTDNKEAFISREKTRARELRDSAWWKNRIASGVCHYCGRKFSPSELTMDHVIPLARGGVSEKINIVPACKECNNKKKYMLPVEWEEYMSKIKNG